MNTCFSRCGFLIKGCNWCYLRLGRSRGPGREGGVSEKSGRDGIGGAEETGSLCVILSGWRSELRWSRRHRECTEPLWTALIFGCLHQEPWVSPGCLHVGSFSTLCIKWAQCCDRCAQWASQRISGWAGAQNAREQGAGEGNVWRQVVALLNLWEQKSSQIWFLLICGVFGTAQNHKERLTCYSAAGETTREHDPFNSEWLM